MDHELLTTIATEAAVLVDNAMLAQAEESGRREREELKIAAEIQQGLMAVRIPELAYAEVRAHSVPCRTIGGDFYDVISLDDGLYVVLADVSGKGVSAAILASTLQGLIHAQLLAGQPLAQIAHFANRYICNKNLNKYATLVILHVNRQGHAEYINCGHVQPLLYAGGRVRQLPNTNVPVGLIADAAYMSDYLLLQTGDRVMIVTDGITEAEPAGGESYGDARLEQLVAGGARMEEIFGEVIRFMGGTPLEDDCTLVEVCYGTCVA
jgi:serine phosphatase RsbU (regulator of sigma subunit)